MATSPRYEDTSYTDPNGVVVGGSPAVDNSGVRTSTTATALSSTWTDNSPIPASTSTAAPPTAASAPTKTTYTGLCTALNAFQQTLVKVGQASIADQYEIIFNPPGLIGGATISKPGGTVQKNTPMNQDTTAAAKLDPAKSSVNSAGYTVPITAGTQIVQFIDEVIKSSSYITNQASISIDKETGKMKPNANNTNGQIAWYKVNVDATPLGYDTVRKQDAYKMTFLITPFGISEMQSEYFPQANFRGVHKSYNYWFTGQNTQVLHFEQDYNYLFRQVFTAKIQPGISQQSDSRDFYQRTWAVASAESSKGADNAANEVGANAADWMYSKSDFASIKLKIIGDPSWLQQGEVASGVTPANFSFQPYLGDGTINFDSQQICFDMSWNAPTDYNFNTGIADVTVNNLNRNTTNLPQENQTYMFVECTSTFNKGRFEQELVGKLIANPQKKKATTTPATPGTTATTSPVAPTGSTTNTDNGVRQPNVAAGTESNVTNNPSPQSPTPANTLETSPSANPQPLPATAATAPTSDGSIAGIPGSPGDLTTAVNSTPQNMNIET